MPPGEHRSCPRGGLHLFQNKGPTLGSCVKTSSSPLSKGQQASPDTKANAAASGGACSSLRKPRRVQQPGAEDSRRGKALPGLCRRKGPAGRCRLGTWSPPGTGRSEPAGEQGSGHGAVLGATTHSLGSPSGTHPPPRVPQIHHQHPSQLAEQQFTTSLCLQRDMGQAMQVTVLPAVPPTTQIQLPGLPHQLHSPF